LGASPANIAQDIQAQGTALQATAQAWCLASPIVSTRDIWVNHQSGECFEITKVQNEAEMKKVPIAHNLILEPLPASDAVYEFNWKCFDTEKDG
jgi:hypothetical protein